ncbi:uncharacterized protein ISCGN_027979 [Ixodes scapularis]
MAGGERESEKVRLLGGFHGGVLAEVASDRGPTTSPLAVFPSRPVQDAMPHRRRVMPKTTLVAPFPSSGSSSPKRCSKPQQPQHQQPVIMVKNGLSFLQNNLSLVKISPPGSPGETRGPQGLVVALESSGPESANYRSPTAQSQLRPQLYVRSQSSQQFPRSLHEPTVRVQQLPPNFSRTASCSTISPEAVSSPVHQRIRPKNPK